MTNTKRHNKKRIIYNILYKKSTNSFLNTQKKAKFANNMQGAPQHVQFDCAATFQALHLKHIGILY